MSFADLLRRKKKPDESGKMPEGEKRSAGNKEEFMNLCHDLSKDFMGVMRLYSKTDGKKYGAALLLDKGNIIGASFEDETLQLTTFKEDALENIKNKLAGTTGDLEVFSFKEGDVDSVKSQNPEVLLEKIIAFSDLGIKIRLNIIIDESGNGSQCSPGKKGSGIKQINLGSKFRLTEFARGIPVSVSIPKMPDAQKQSERENELLFGKKKTPEMDLKLKMPSGPGGKLISPLSAAKSERLAEIKKARQKEDLELMKRISQITTKKPVEQKALDSCKVETSIDHLYQLVQKMGRVKIDDELARRLNVPRPQIESWSLILEEHNLVELHYPAIGEPEIRKKEDKK